MTLEPKRARTLALAIAAVLGLSTLRIELLVDDHLFHAAWSGLDWFHQGSWDLYTFAPGDAERMGKIVETGPFPWWTYPELKIRFFRPLSSLLMAADYALWGEAVWLWHLHSVAWWLATVAVVAALARRFLGPRAAALAIVLFALDDGHWMAVGWEANRHVLISALPSLLGFWAWVRWREDGKGWGLPLALLLFTLGLAAGESALAVLAMVGCWTLWGRPQPLVRAAPALLPLAVLGLGYIGLYKAFGYGSFGSAVYVDPTAQPLAFLARGAPRLLALCASLTTGVFSEAYMAHKAAPWVMSGLGLAGAGGLWLALRALWADLEPATRASLRWVPAATVAALVPCVATFPADRSIFAASIGGACLLGAVLSAALLRRGPWLALAGGVALMHVALPLLLWAVAPSAAAKLERATRDASLNTPISDQDLRGRVLFLVAPDILFGAYPPLLRHEAGKGLALGWNLISAAPFDHELLRAGERSLELWPVGGAFVGTTWEHLFRDPRVAPFSAGTRVRLSGSTLTVLALKDGLPARVRLDFDDDLAAYTLIQWKGGALVPLVPPAVGELIRLRQEPGPLEQAVGVRTGD